MALPIRNYRIAVNQFKYIMGLGSKAVLERDAHLQIKPNDSNAVLIIDRLTGLKSNEWKEDRQASCRT